MNTPSEIIDALESVLALSEIEQLLHQYRQHQNTPNNSFEKFTQRFCPPKFSILP